jgi:hypothetical protein
MCDLFSKIAVVFCALVLDSGSQPGSFCRVVEAGDAYLEARESGALVHALETVNVHIAAVNPDFPHSINPGRVQDNDVRSLFSDIPVFRSVAVAYDQMGDFACKVQSVHSSHLLSKVCESDLFSQ